MSEMSLNREALQGLIDSVDRIVIVEMGEDVLVEGQMLYRLRGAMMEMEPGEAFVVSLIQHRYGDLLRFGHMSAVNRDWVIRGIGHESLVGDGEIVPGAELEALIH